MFSTFSSSMDTIEIQSGNTMKAAVTDPTLYPTLEAAAAVKIKTITGRPEDLRPPPLKVFFAITESS